MSKLFVTVDPSSRQVTLHNDGANAATAAQAGDIDVSGLFRSGYDAATIQALYKERLVDAESLITAGVAAPTAHRLTKTGLPS